MGIVLRGPGRPLCTFGSLAMASRRSPSVSSAPLTSTVMRSAKLNTRSMSCSMSSTDTSGRQRGHGLPAARRRSAGRHARHGLVEQQHARLGRRSAMAISSRRLLAVGHELASAGVQPRRRGGSCSSNCPDRARRLRPCPPPSGRHQLPRRCPCCCDHGERRCVSSGVIESKSWLIWKVRTSPRRHALDAAASVVMSSPQQRACGLRSGVSTPVSRLIEAWSCRRRSGR